MVKEKVEVIIPVIRLHGISTVTGFSISFHPCPCGNDCAVAELMDEIYEINYTVNIV